jgi:NAD(P)-dependent dehydrogenase (short-subunit alcohol dehydrogenase family)
MTSTTQKIAFITGASSGIGRAAAEALAQLGCRVYGTSRNPQAGPEQDQLEGKAAPGFFRLIPLNVCDDASVKQAVDHVLNAEGRIDILVNNAGFALAGPIEETTPEEALRQMDTNFLGTFRMCRQVLPIMRRQRSGLIINVGSVMGLISLPFQSMYSASKYSLEALTEALRMEAGPDGIRAVVVEPGDTKTGMTDARQITEQAKQSSYGARFTRSIAKMAKDEQNGPGPETVARVIVSLVNKKNPPIRVTVGLTYKVFVLIRRLLPARLSEYIIQQMY